MKRSCLSLVILILALIAVNVSASSDSAWTGLSATDSNGVNYTLDLSLNTIYANNSNGTILLSHNIFSGVRDSEGGEGYTLYLGYFFPNTKPPTVTVTANVTQGCADLPVHFQAEAYDPDGGYSFNYNWTITHDDTGEVLLSESGNQSKLNYTFTDTGTYTIKVIVTDDDGETAVNYTSVAVCNNGACDGSDLSAVNMKVILDSIHLTDRPFFVEGEPISANVTIFNLGASAVFNYSLDDTGKVLKYATLSMGNCTEKTVALIWKTEYIGKVGHLFSVVLDPENNVEEENEMDNLASRQFSVYPGGSCNISSAPVEIASLDCKTDAKNDHTFCPSGNVTSCCGPTNSHIEATAMHPKYTISSCNVENDEVKSCSNSGYNADIGFDFNSTKLGTHNFLVIANFSDGSSCIANTSVLVTKSGMTLTSPDVAVDRIELIPQPKLNYKSKIYVFISNHGHANAGGIGVNGTIYVGPPVNTIVFPVKNIDSLPPGGSTKVYLGEWTPSDTDQHTLTVTASYNGLDSNWANNYKEVTVGVGTQRKMGGKLTNIPEYPGPVLALVLGLLVLVELVRRKRVKVK